MGIFQNSVLRNTKQDESILAHRWASFQDFLAKTEAIKDFKEEIYQDGFLHDVFENCLGYTLKTTNPNNYSLDREQKNETDGKKADAAIFIDRNSLGGKASNASLQQTAHGTGAANDKIVVGVIELKDQKSKNLDVIEAQAFGYHASHANSRYIIISNFDELRFYIDKKSYYEKFNLFNLDFDEFRKLHLILSFESISSGLTNRLLEQSNRFEVDISKKLYSDFSDFRTHLFENIVKNNIDIDKQTLLRLTQKLCDRLIFILFAEDRGLLRPNTIKEIRGEFANQKFTSYTLYDIYKFYFDAISSGNDRLDIQKYNGGLFAKDELLDSLKIDDEQIDLKAQKLSDYDFMSDIGVNILGHIFEQSLSDIEELNASINDTEFDRKKSKRKKDGVFYTPEYITRYIVENTLGKLCTDKKAELGIGDESVHPEPVEGSNLDKQTLTVRPEPVEGLNGSSKTNKPKLIKAQLAYKQNILEYRAWLTNLKILDPACGSGAFLNQALEFLIREHTFVRDILLPFQDLTLGYEIETAILEHNLYGVDINEDAVEIAKLSLWLRTAQKGRMLTNLSDKIVCANSLLDMPFAENSFDVVIGNPPYIKEYTNKNAFDGLRGSPYYQGKMDLWYFFGCQALDLIKENGLIGFIAPNNWISNAGASKFRNKVLNDGKILEFIDFGDFKVFEDAGIQTMIYVMTKTKNNENYKLQVSKLVYKNITHIEASDFLYLKNSNHFESFISTINKTKQLDNIISFSNQTIEIVLDKIKNQQNFILDNKEVAQGIVPPQDFINQNSKNILGDGFNVGDGIFNLSQNEYQNLHLTEKEKSLVKPFYTTNELEKFWGNRENNLWVIYTNSSFKNINSLDNYPNIKNHLDKFQIVITSDNKPYGLHRARDEKFFKNEKIISLRKCKNPTFTYTNFDCYVSQTYFAIQTERTNLKFLTALLNSKVIAFWLKNKGKMQGDLFQVDKEPLMNLPILNPENSEQQPFIELVDEILEAKEKIKKYKKHFDTLNAVDKIEITEEIEKLESLVQNNENTIDQMVYKLYGLSSDEIKVVEGF